MTAAAEDVRVAAPTGRTRSRPLHRRLRLLQPLLPRMPEAIAHAASASRRYDRAFWVECLNPCVTMELAQWRFDLLHDAHHGIVGGVLTGLEQVVQLDEGDIPQMYRATPFPRLETLATMSESGNACIKLVRPDNAGGLAFIESLNDLAAVIADNTNMKSRPPPETAKLSPSAKPLLAPFVLNLFSTLSSYFQCTDSHQAALALFTNRASSADDDASASFTVLLSNPSRPPTPAIEWLETRVTVRDPRPKSTVLPTPGHPHRPLVADLCPKTKGSKTMRVELNVDGSSLLDLGKTDLSMKAFQKCEPVSFRRGFLENAAELGFEGRICLAVVLSFSFLDFCGRPWFPRGWTKDSLFLMQNRDRLSLQPFLVTAVPPRGRPLSPPPASAAVWETKLLDHGILLMEVFKQDTFPHEHKRAHIDARKAAAKEWFESITWDVREHSALAVEACIEGTLIDRLRDMLSRPTAHDVAGPSGRQPPIPAEGFEEAFAKLFVETILAPLEADFASQWLKQDPDRAISTLGLPTVAESPSASPRAGAANPKHRQGVVPLRARTRWAPRTPDRQTHLQPRQPTRTLCRPTSPAIDKGRFFDTSNSPDSAEINSALRWFEYFEEIKDKLPAGAGSKDKHIKIGVLDTGIDLDNDWISQRRGRIRCWPPGTDCSDHDGHGTHVAHLLLRLTKHAHLRVCKIANSTYIKDAEIARIAEAITHFSQPGEDHVDILSLSFGFPKYDDVLEPINQAIRAARNNNVIIFAAAGNEGGNAGVSWPALLHETGDVIRINSSDGQGSPSGPNPAPEMGRWIHTLGRGVPSCQLLHGARPGAGGGGEPRLIYRSGSSFATPIAAAIAAIILGVVDRVDPSRYPDDLVTLRPRLRTRLGMEKVLCRTCVGPGTSDSFYLTPWHFFRDGEETQVHVILSILMQVSPEGGGKPDHS